MIFDTSDSLNDIVIFRHMMLKVFGKASKYFPALIKMPLDVALVVNCNLVLTVSGQK